jgi:NADPH2:quinone reductase
MKAIIVRDYGPVNAIEYGEMPDPIAGKKTVVIEASDIGVNYPDGLLVQGLYQMKPPTPFVPGMEVAGIVSEVGPGVTAFKPGDRVAALCGIGGYAQKVAVPEDRVMALPPQMSGADACALMCGYGTSHHALKQRARLQEGETLCVTGAAGATGIAAIQIGKTMGARVIAVASTPEKQKIAREAGADEAIGYGNLKEELKGLTGGNGVDVAFDPVGGKAFDALSRAMAWKGRLLVVGFASGTIPNFPTNLALLKGYSLVGVFWGSFTQKEPQIYAENMRELIGWYLNGKVKPVIEARHPLADAGKVLDHVLKRGAHGKLVLVP